MTTLSDTDSAFIERFLNAFKTIGGNELGFIDYNVFKSLLNKISGGEGSAILNLVNEEQHVREGKLDFISLCFSIITFKTVFNSFSSENGKVQPLHPGVNSHTYVKKKGFNSRANGHSTNLTGIETLFTKSVKGILFCKDGDQLGYRYQLEILENSMVEVFAKSAVDESQDNKTPIEILVFQDGKKKLFITSSTVINDSGYCSVKFHLKKGKYVLIPLLLKWDQISNDVSCLQDVSSLMQCSGDSNPELSLPCENALKKVFDAVDVDDNGLLNQQEFDLFIRHTSGETAAEEWSTVEDNFKMKNGQLTFDGFLELYRLVLQTDPPDLLNMFQQMGINDKFELKNVKRFVLVVKSETAKFHLSPLPVSSYLEVSEKVLKKTAVEQGVSSKIKDMNDLFLFKQSLPHRVTLVIQNQSHRKMTVNLDCSESINCESHRKNLNYSVEITPRTSKIVHHLFPVDVNKDWTVECKESIKNNIK